MAQFKHSYFMLYMAECFVLSNLGTWNLEHNDFCRKQTLPETKLSLPIIYFPCIIFYREIRSTHYCWLVWSLTINNFTSKRRSPHDVNTLKKMPEAHFRFVENNLYFAQCIHLILHGHLNVWDHLLFLAEIAL